MDQDDRFTLSVYKEMNLHSLGVEASGPRLIGSQNGEWLRGNRQYRNHQRKARVSFHGTAHAFLEMQSQLTAATVSSAWR